MSVPSIETDNTSSTIIDDDMSMIVNDSSDTTVATQTSTSWHSVISDVQINNNLFLRSPSINTWLKICSIEPDIRLTTAQEWKLRMCLRRFLSLCDLPLKISWLKEEDSIAHIEQTDSTLRFDNRLEKLGLYLHRLSITNATDEFLEVTLVEFYSDKLQNRTIPLLKSRDLSFTFPEFRSIKFTNCELTTSVTLFDKTRSKYEDITIDGTKEKMNMWRYNITTDVDQSLINELQTI